MSSSAKVLDLQEKAFEVFYKDLLCKAKPSTVEFVRGCINQQLIGSMRGKIREKCFDRLMKTYSSKRVLKQLPNATVLLDCILDKSLLKGDEKSLALKIPFLSSQSFSKLLSVIASRCPDVGYLVITFKRSSFSPQQQLEPFAPHSYLSSLSHLVLKLDGYDYNSVRDSNKSIFSIIGKSCPNLECLENLCFAMSKKDVLALIVKEDLVDILFPNAADNFDDGWSQDSLLPGLQIPPEFLNPLCTTLQELLFNRDEEELYPFTDPVLLAFALRHLKKIVSPVPEPQQIAQLVKIICKAEKKMATRQGDFGEACRAAAISIGLQMDLIPSPGSAIPDFFLFTKTLEELEYVPLDDVDTLRVLGSLCPRLVSVEFLGDSDCIDELESILSQWPNLERVTFTHFNPKCLKPVLNAFGSSLKWLQLEHCPFPFDLAELAPCLSLQLLVIWGCTIKRIAATDENIHWTAETFLPLLEYLTIWRTTLGDWAPFLETKTTLKRLAVECEVHTPRLPELLWSNLECLGCDQNTKLTKEELSMLTCELKRIWRYRVGVTENIMQHFHAIKISVERGNDSFSIIQEMRVQSSSRS